MDTRSACSGILQRQVLTASIYHKVFCRSKQTLLRCSLLEQIKDTHKHLQLTCRLAGLWSWSTCGGRFRIRGSSGSLSGESLENITGEPACIPQQSVRRKALHKTSSAQQSHSIPCRQSLLCSALIHPQKQVSVLCAYCPHTKG